jgi:NADH-quinone oxidoreductase subunit L
VAEASPAAFLTLAYDGDPPEAGPAANAALIDHHAHQVLAWAVGYSFLVGFIIAIAIYARGLALATKLAAALKPLHTLLEHKFYFDELYGLVLIGGTMGLMAISYAFDKYVVDGLVNLSAWITERVSWFSGMIVDQGVVDGAVNGVGKSAMGLGGLVRSPQDGRIRNYILFAAGSVAVVVLWVAFA